MPQLNPAPWFIILVFSWAAFLIIIPPKITSHFFPKEPTSQTSQKPKTESWKWPW